MNKILLVEDEDNIARLISHNLQKEGFQVEREISGKKALYKLNCVKFDLVILDIMLPELDGLEVLKYIRNNITERHVPVIMLTAKSEELDKVLGLEMGADDYVTKPFSPRELSARVKAQLRGRTGVNASNNNFDIITVDKLMINIKKHRVTINGEDIDLTPKEFELLVLLAKHPGQVFSRDNLLDRIWGYDFPGGTRTVDVHVRYLRRKLIQMGASENLIETIRGLGYRLKEKR